MIHVSAFCSQYETKPNCSANIVSYSFSSGASKQWAMEVKMNTAVRSHCFLDEMTLATSGVDADVYIWDLRKTGRCVAR